MQARRITIWNGAEHHMNKWDSTTPKCHTEAHSIGDSMGIPQNCLDPFLTHYFISLCQECWRFSFRSTLLMLLQTLWHAAKKSWVGLSEKVPDTSGLGLQNPVLLEIFPKIYPVIHILFMKPHMKSAFFGVDVMTYVELSLQAGL